MNQPLEGRQAFQSFGKCKIEKLTLELANWILLSEAIKEREMTKLETCHFQNNTAIGLHYFESRDIPFVMTLTWPCKRHLLDDRLPVVQSGRLCETSRTAKYRNHIIDTCIKLALKSPTKPTLAELKYVNSILHTSALSHCHQTLSPSCMTCIGGSNSLSRISNLYSLEQNAETVRYEVVGATRDLLRTITI